MIKKKCRRHLGTKVAKPFREGIDDEDDSYLDPFDGSKRIGGFMDWMVNRVSLQVPWASNIPSLTTSSGRGDNTRQRSHSTILPELSGGQRKEMGRNIISMLASCGSRKAVASL